MGDSDIKCLEVQTSVEKYAAKPISFVASAQDGHAVNNREKVSQVRRFPKVVKFERKSWPSSHGAERGTWKELRVPGCVPVT